jgi:Cys-tRNA(Pro)/Cys-tRNA(Cys) deacylase
MFTLDELQNYLSSNNSDFEILEHDAPIITTQDAAKYFDIEESAPTLILDTEQGLIACIVSSGRGRLDFKAMKIDLGFSKMKLAEKADVLKATGYHAGAIPFIGHNLPCIFDNRLLAFDYIYGGSGNELHTLKIAPKDIIRLSNVIKFID